MAVVNKTAGSIGSAPSDPVKDQTALSPLPVPAIENKPAPGQTGPKGMSPRTTYSKVNSGSPPVMDAGAMGQKSSPNRGMEFLPAKVAAQRGSMTTMQERPSLQAMVKAAMAGTSNALQVNLEAARQNTKGSVKTASAQPSDAGRVSTETVTKLASALEYIEDLMRKEADGPGEGPGATTVTQASSSGENPIQPGSTGQATSGNQPPMGSPLQPDKVQEGNAGTGLQTNDDMQHPEQPVEPIKNAAAQLLQRLNGGSKEASAMGKAMAARDAAKGAIGAAKGAIGAAAKKGVEAGKAAGGKVLNVAKEHKNGLSAAALGATAGAAGYGAGRLHQVAKDHEKKASAPLALIRQLTTKQAEDAINPAQISAEKGQGGLPAGASASGEGVPSEPSDVSGQKSMIASNEAAINYTKGQAKADPKKDVAQVLNEPPLSAAHDKVLDQAFDNTGRAGVKISSAGSLAKVASQVGAQRVLLGNLLKRASADVQNAGR